MYENALLEYLHSLCYATPCNGINDEIGYGMKNLATEMKRHAVCAGSASMELITISL